MKNKFARPLARASSELLAVWAVVEETPSGKAIFKIGPSTYQKWSQKARVHAYIHTFVREVLRFFAGLILVILTLILTVLCCILPSQALS